MSAKPGSPEEVMKALEKAGFSIQEGKFAAVDVFGMADAGILEDANYQNAGAPYLTVKLPPAPDQAPCYLSDAAINPAYEGLYIDYRLQPYEAVVLVGKTPPRCRYFGYDANVWTRWSDATGKPALIFGNYGDPINPIVIKTDGPADDPYERNTMIIMTADRGIDSMIKDAAGTAGYPEDMINDYPIPSGLLHLGLGKESDTLLLLHRFAYPSDHRAGQAYLANPDMRVFRVTPERPPKPDPYAVPTFRRRGNGNSRELEMSKAVEELRRAILKKYHNLAAQEPVTSPWGGGADGVDGLVALQEMVNVQGPGRDGLYLGTTEFTLADDPDEFLIVYGVNHTATAKATYGSVSVYGIEKANGVASVSDSEYAGTAEEFLPGNPNAKDLYVWRIARRADGDPHTTVVPFNQGINGVELDKKMLLIFREYIEPETRTGPLAMELYFDRTIKFSKKQ